MPLNARPAAIQAARLVRTAVERRDQGDRRGQKTPMFSRFTFLGGRRGGGRRDGETQGIYVDRYGWQVSGLILAILLLNVMDAYFTLVFVQLGGEEANPIAQACMDLGDIPFILVKTALIGACLLVLLMHHTFYAVSRVLQAICVFYSLLILYHLVIQVLVVPRIA